MQNMSIWGDTICCCFGGHPPLPMSGRSHPGYAGDPQMPN
jgi:hypothetical protein